MISRAAVNDFVLNRLPAGWQSGSAVPDEFLQVWRERVGLAEKTGAGDNWVEFTADLGKIKLRGTGEIWCLLLSGDSGGNRTQLREFVSRASASGRILLVIAGSLSALSTIKVGLAGVSRLVTITPEMLHEAISGDNWTELFASRIRQTLPLRALIAFDIAVSAQGGMFYGRGDELGRLHDEAKINFIIAGPGKIGKTSLVRQYHLRLKREGRASNTFYVDFFECADRSPLHWPRFLALKIDGSLNSSKVTLQDLPNFLRRFRRTLGSTPTLILDEMDEIISHSENTRQLLASIEKQELCRFIFCGRGEVYKAARNSQTGLGGRFRLMRLEPLDEASACRLFSEPLESLGLKFLDREKILSHVLHMTGRLPQLIQYYGQSLAEMAVRASSYTLDASSIEKLNNDFETAQYFTSPLEDLSSPEIKLVAYCLLQDQSNQGSIARLQSLLARHRIEFPVEEL